MTGWVPAPELAWERRARLTQYTPDVPWGSVSRPGRSGWSALRVRALTVLVAAGAAAAMLFAPDAQAAPSGMSCRTDLWGVFGMQRRTLCDSAARPDGSWERLRVFWTPAYTTPINCYGRYYISCWGGEFVDERVNSSERYWVTPGTVLPDEPQHLVRVA